MEWVISLNEEIQYAEVVTRGVADKDGSLEMAKDISRMLSQAKIKKLLIDHRNIKAVSGGIIEIYQPDESLSSGELARFALRVPV